jgi:hypothetical protein
MNGSLTRIAETIANEKNPIDPYAHPHVVAGVAEEKSQ